MADSYSGIRVLEKIANRASDNVASSKHNCLLASRVNTAGLEKGHHGFGSAWHKQRAATPLGQLSDVYGSKSINVFLVSDSGGNCVLREVLG
jgi:hypothetical protein